MKYRLDLPRGLEKGAPLLVALHGCRQSSDDFAAGTRFHKVAERYGVIVAYPEQDERLNGHRCWNWFLPENQHRDGVEPAAIIGIVDEIARMHSVDRARIFVAGLSAGASTAAILAEQAPDVFAGVGLMAGVALHSAHDVQSAYAAMQAQIHPNRALLPRPGSANGVYARSRAIVWAGRDDRVVDPRNAQWLTEQFGTLFGLEVPGVAEESLEDGWRILWRDAAGKIRLQLREIDGIGHAWSGGSLRGSYTAPTGPSASEAMLRFFLEEQP